MRAGWPEHGTELRRVAGRMDDRRHAFRHDGSHRLGEIAGVVDSMGGAETPDEFFVARSGGAKDGGAGGSGELDGDRPHATGCPGDQHDVVRGEGERIHQIAGGQAGQARTGRGERRRDTFRDRDDPCGVEEHLLCDGADEQFKGGDGAGDTVTHADGCDAVAHGVHDPGEVATEHHWERVRHRVPDIAGGGEHVDPVHRSCLHGAPHLSRSRILRRNVLHRRRLVATWNDEGTWHVKSSQAGRLPGSVKLTHPGTSPRFGVGWPP